MYINEEIDRLGLNVDIEDDQLKFQYFVSNLSPQRAHNCYDVRTLKFFPPAEC